MAKAIRYTIADKEGKVIHECVSKRKYTVTQAISQLIIAEGYEPDKADKRNRSYHKHGAKVDQFAEII